MNCYRREYERQHPRRGVTPTVLNIISVLIAIVIVAIVARLDAHSETAPTIIYPGTDIVGKTADVGIAPGVSIYVPGAGCDEDAESTGQQETETNIDKQKQTSTNNAKQHEYSSITISDSEMEELRRIVAAEAQTQSMEGRRAVVEVIFNRVLSPEYPDTVHGVLSQKGQFATWKYMHSRWVEPELADAAIAYVMENGRTVLPNTSYLYFDTSGVNGRKHIKIGAHYFGRE